MSIRIVLLPGDGIGPEVTNEAELLIRAVAAIHGLDIKMESALIGGAAIDATGNPLPDATLAACREADAVVLGAVGGPKWSDPDAAVRPEQGLLKIRKELGLYANLRPVRLHPSLLDASPLKPEYLEGVDMMVVRELTGGSYFGEKQEGDEYAMDSCCLFTRGSRASGQTCRRNCAYTPWQADDDRQGQRHGHVQAVAQSDDASDGQSLPRRGIGIHAGGCCGDVPGQRSGTF